MSKHYKQKDKGSRSTFVPDEHSVQENHPVDMNKVLLPPFHIKHPAWSNEEFCKGYGQKWRCLLTLVHFIPSSEFC